MPEKKPCQQNVFFLQIEHLFNVSDSSNLSNIARLLFVQDVSLLGFESGREDGGERVERREYQHRKGLVVAAVVAASEGLVAREGEGARPLLRE